MAARSTGKVNWFSDNEGFGFITPDDSSEKLLVNRSSISGATSLSVGEKVGYVKLDGIAEATNVITLGFPVECFRCGQLGHIGRDCPSENTVCFGCKKEGHVYEDCTESGIKCRRCNNFGHKQKNCPGSSGGGAGGSGGRGSSSSS